MDDAAQVRWLTYADLAAALGVKGESARKMGRRKRWARRTNNRGETLLAVPVALLPPEGQSLQTVSPDGPSSISQVLPDSPGTISRDRPGTVSPDAAPAVMFAVATLARQIERLEAEAMALRERAGQTEIRAAALEAERTVLREALDEARRALAAALARPASVPTIVPARRSWWPFKRAG